MEIKIRIGNVELNISRSKHNVIYFFKFNLQFKHLQCGPSILNYSLWSLSIEHSMPSASVKLTTIDNLISAFINTVHSLFDCRVCKRYKHCILITLAKRIKG